jgi:hypothetical protein
MIEIIIAAGIPSAVMGILVWWLKRYIDKQEEKRLEREKNTEEFMLFIMKNSRATNILAEATAKAVQRIPDAHCNGDMKAALEEAAKIQRDEKEFMFNQGVKRIFGD